MSNNDFQQLATRGGFVRWTDSSLIEYIYRTKRTKSIFAQNLITKRYHRLNGQYDIWKCEELKRTEMVRLGDLVKKKK